MPFDHHRNVQVLLFLALLWLSACKTSPREMTIVGSRDKFHAMHLYRATPLPRQHRYIGLNGQHGTLDEKDGLAVGDLLAGKEQEIVIAEDDGGGVDVWAWSNRQWVQVAAFVSDFDQNDAFTVGDVFGNDKVEIIIGEDGGTNQGYVDVWSWNGSQFVLVDHFKTSLDEGELAVGNVTGGANEQILVAEQGIPVQVWEWDASTGKFQLSPYSFDSSFRRGDAFLIGDVGPYLFEEILICKRDDNEVHMMGFDPSNQILEIGIYDLDTIDGRRLDENDGVAVGYVDQEGSFEELLVAEDDEGTVDMWRFEMPGDRFQYFQSVHTDFEKGDILLTGLPRIPVAHLTELVTTPGASWHMPITMGKGGASFHWAYCDDGPECHAGTVEWAGIVRNDRSKAVADANGHNTACGHGATVRSSSTSP